jgi:FKBP-type peptidyl-prolyl cis-trans isomerase FklB
MKIGLNVLMAAGLGVAVLQLPSRAEDKPAFKDDKEKASYAVGVYFGTMVKRSNFDLDMEVTVNAMKDAIAGKDCKLNEQQVKETLGNYQMQAQQKAAEKNKQAGVAFLAENKKKDGVKTKTITLGDGKTAELQYKVLKEGTGATPGSNDMVSVNYRGTFIDGKEFDSSAKHGDKPAKFPVRGVVPGWTEALQMMKVGSKWEVYLPSDLAYGDRGSRDIGPGTTLVFEMELVGAEAPPPPAPPAQPLTSDIIKVPSADEMKKGAKIEVLKPEDAAKMAKEQQPAQPAAQKK